MSFSFSQMIDFGVNRPITNINHHASHQALFVIASHTTNWVRTSKKEFWISVGMAQVPSQMTCPTWYQVPGTNYRKTYQPWILPSAYWMVILKSACSPRTQNYSCYRLYSGGAYSSNSKRMAHTADDYRSDEE